MFMLQALFVEIASRFIRKNHISITGIFVVVFACIIYVIESPAHGFTSIPLSIYWAVVNITTVGYGDLVPQTAAGRFVAGFGMLVGCSIIAVQTAIITRKLWDRINEQGAAKPTLP